MTHWLAWLLFDFRGRIPRKSWWLAQAILLAAGIGVYIAMHGLTLPKPRTPVTIPEILVQVLFLIPAFAVARKRLNDRGHRLWVTLLWLGLSGLGLIAAYFDLLDPEHLTVSEQVLLAVMMIVSLWLFIDLGFLRGERGPNSHGPDPLGTTEAGPARRGRTVGENIRDAVTGLAALIAVLSISGLGIGFQPLIERILIPSQLRQDMEVAKLRQANEPATKVHEEGVAASNAGDNDAALRHFSRAIDLFGNENLTSVRTYMWRGYVLERMNRLAEALADYDQALAINPDSVTARQRRAALLTRLGRYDQALKDLDAALEYEPDSAWIYMDRGDTLAEAGRYDEAFPEYEKATKAANDRYKTMIWLGEKLDAMLPEEQRQEHEKSLERVVGHRDDLLAQVHMHRGNVFRMMKETDKALSEYAEALRLDPDFGYIYANRGWLHEQQGRSVLARADYEKAAALMEPDDWLKRALERTK